MDKLRFYTEAYGSLIEPLWMHPNMYTPLRRILRKLASKRLPHYFDSHPYEKVNKKEKDLIVSFTSFPARIGYAFFVVQSMLRQTIKPEKIYLWLSKKQFLNKTSLPPNLLSLENDCFEIKFVEDDIRSHKKYYYTCLEHPGSKVVLLDDDIIYSPFLLERLLDAYNDGNANVICNYGHLIKRDNAGHLLPYKQWTPLRSERIGDDVFFGSGGGTLICPKDFDPILTDIDLALKLTPNADDIWLNSIARYSKLRIKMIKHGGLLPVLIPRNKSLYTSNVNENQNDIQLNNVCTFFEKKDFVF